MPDDALFETVAEIGPPLAGTAPGDWLFAATFGAALSDQADLRAIAQKVRDRFGPGMLAGVEEGTKGTPSHKVHLLFAPDGDLAAAMWEMLELIQRGERVCDVTWNDFAEAAIGLRWHTMHIADRLALAEEAQVPADAALRAEPCDEVHTLLYRDLD